METIGFTCQAECLLLKKIHLSPQIIIPKYFSLHMDTYFSKKRKFKCSFFTCSVQTAFDCLCTVHAEIRIYMQKLHFAKTRPWCSDHQLIGRY
jgi:hypothetical protein